MGRKAPADESRWAGMGAACLAIPLLAQERAPTHNAAHSFLPLSQYVTSELMQIDRHGGGSSHPEWFAFG